jgi:hypothetical protein
VLVPFVAGASYYFGVSGPGSVWMGAILLTCLVIYTSLFRARTQRNSEDHGP